MDIGRASRPLVLMLIVGILGIATATKSHGQTRLDDDPPVVINEILAANRSAVQDPQRDYDDWVELYNPSGMTFDVGGMYLTDDSSDLTKWQFPTDAPATTTIAPRDYLVIWADGDVSAAGLHAGFKLDADGEELLLVATDGTTVVDHIEFGLQIADVSYGRYPDDDPNLRYMAAPTPGATNSDVYEGIAAEPQFSLQSGLCRESTSITLSTETPDATIYYTLDGRNPYSEARDRPGGFTYTGPIVVTYSTTIKAVAWRPGWRQSPVHTERYTFLDSDLEGFSSPLPIAVIDTLGSSVSTSQVPAYSYFIDTDQTGRAAVTNPTDFAGWAGINVRGKSSEGFAKKQYHFEAWDQDDKDKAVSILGFPADADWVLQGPYSDKSLMRNALVYRWSREMGRYAPRTRFIEMFLNTGDSTVSMDDYVGVYVFMEKIKISSDRVDVGQLEPSDNAEPEITGGYIIKKDKFDGGDATFTTSSGLTLIHEDPTGDDLTQAQRNWIKNYVNAFEAALYGTDFRDPTAGYAAYIDVGSFIDHHILVELAKNIDGFRLSTYMSKTRGGKLSMGPVWDYNLSLGNANYLNGWISSGWYHDQLGDGDYPWWRRLFQDTEFQLAYADRWFALRRDRLDTDRLLGMIDDYAALLEEPQQRNFNRWPILGQYVWPNWFIARTYGEEITWMKGWLVDRLTWLDSEIAAEYAAVPPAFSQQGGHVEQGDILAMASSSDTIYYTLDGTDPRAINPSALSSRTVVLVAEEADKRVLVPTEPVDDAWRGGRSFDDSTWTAVTGRPGGVGYERSTGYEDYISFDVGESMYGQQASCYLRIPFVPSESVRNFGALTLRVRYDDGFVAYLNGVEIARSQITGTPAWNAGADEQHSDVDAVAFETFDVSDSDQILHRGTNVLAIHGLNVSPTSSDFLVSAELVATVVDQDDVVADVYPYDEPLVLTRSTQVKARSLNGTAWSALNEATFAVGPVGENLRISELMYHPAETGNPDDPNMEFVELINVGSEAIDLNLVRFVEGIDFVFPSVELAPGECILVVKDIAAFETKYGNGLAVAGQYTGSLSNAGERLVLQDAAGTVIQEFSYRDDWYDVTDGDGFSLTALDPLDATPEDWSRPAGWLPSFDVGGSPGIDEVGTGS